MIGSKLANDFHSDLSLANKRLVVGSCGVAFVTDRRAGVQTVLLDDLTDLKLYFEDKKIVAHGPTAHPLLFECALAKISVDVVVYQPVFDSSVRSDQLRSRYAELPLIGYLVYEFEGATMALGDLCCIVQERSQIGYTFYGSCVRCCSFVENNSVTKEKIQTLKNNSVH